MGKLKRWHITTALVTASAAIVATSAVLQTKDFPDIKLTPGVIRTTDVQDICGHTTSVYRNTTQTMKDRVYAEYGIKSHPPGGYEIDHWYPFAIGGADDVKNLWPMPAPQFHDKDKIESMLRTQLCKGSITQQQAKNIIDHWRTYYTEESSNRLGGVWTEDQDDSE